MGCQLNPVWCCARPALLLCLIVCTSSFLPNLSAAAETNVVQPDYSIYLRKRDLLKKVEDLVDANPDIMKLEIRHAQDEDYKADLQVVTVEPGGLSLSHTTKARMLIDFGEHGREYISSEVGLRFLQVLADAKQLEGVVGSGKRLERIQAILEHVVMKILPMENIHGRDLVESGQLCERKNGRGVDTNRNWDIDWGKKEKDYDPREEFPGKAPHSEPEVQILLGLAKELQPHTWLNVHSGMYALFTPYDHKATVPNTTDAKAALRILHRIKDLVCAQCVVGSGGHSVGYLAHGTGTDYMFEVLGVPMAFTWEIYGDQTAAFEDCFRMFNPLGKEEFERIVILWVKALLHLIELLPTHPAAWPVFRHVQLPNDESGASIPQQPDMAAGTTAVAGTTAPAAQAVQTPAVAQAATPAVTVDAGATQQEQQQPAQQQQPLPPAAAAVDAAKQASGTAAGEISSQQPPVQDNFTDGRSQEAVPDADGKAAAPLTGQVEQQLAQQQKLDSSISRDNSLSTVGSSEEIQIHGVYVKNSDKESDTDAWILLHNKRLVPLLLALAGMGVLLYVVTRPSGTPYTKLSNRRTL